MNAKDPLKTYCLVYKKLTDNDDSETVKNKGRLMMKSICPICETKKKIDLFHKEVVYLIV